MPSLIWSKINHMQLVQYGEFYSKMEFASYVAAHKMSGARKICENKMEYEYNKDYEDLESWSTMSRYDEHYAKIYAKCREIVSGLEGSVVASAQTAEDLKEKFSSDYLTEQIDLMVKMQMTNPTNVIGMAKELIESCCKTILDELGIVYTINDNVPQLVDKTLAS